MRFTSFSRWVAGAVGIAVIALAAFYSCFAERQVAFDEVGLFNPIYMYLHYGRMTYPAHGQFDAMFVHPPTHYFLVATLMRTGLSVHHAAGLLAVILFTTYCALVIVSRFPFAVQLAFLVGGFLGAFVWNQALTLRPDLTLTLAWAAGLVALETARLDDWNPRRLAVGGFLLTLASAVHYPGVAAWMGLLVYAAWMVTSIGWRAFRTPLVWMIAGAAVVAIPVLALFVLPNAGEILAFAKRVQEAAPTGSGTAFQIHRQFYAFMASNIEAATYLRPFITLLTAPLYRSLVPAAFVGPALLLAIPSTRVLGLAALPHLLFIVFGARHKEYQYYTPEITVYLIAVLAVALSGAFAVVARLRRERIATVLALVTAALGVRIAATEHPYLIVGRVLATRGIYDFEAGHAAGRRMLGRDAVVGTTSAGTWYTSGATHLYFVNPEIVYPDDISCLDLKSYWSTFDAVTADLQESWLTYNRQRMNITASYADGLLGLRGFYFADRHDFYLSPLSYLLLSTNRASPLVGYGVKGQKVYRFDEQAGGDQVFLSAVCPLSAGQRHGGLDNTDLQLPFFSIVYPPGATNQNPDQLSDRTAHASIISLIAERRQFEARIRPALQQCTVRERVEGRLTPDDLRSFIKESERDDQTIHFYRTYEEMRQAISTLPGHAELRTAANPTSGCDADATSRWNTEAVSQHAPLTEPGPEFTFQLPRALRLDAVAVAGTGTVRGRTPVVVTTTAEQWAYAASIPLALDAQSGSKRLIHLRARVLKGQVGVGILSRQSNSLQREVFLRPSDQVLDTYFPVDVPDRADDLIVRNVAPNGTASEIAIESAEVLAPARRIDSTVRLEDLESATPQASIRKDRAVTITTSPQRWAYAAAVRVRPPGVADGLFVRVRGRVVHGEIGIGLLSADQRSFLVEESRGASDAPLDIALPLPSPGAPARLIIRNTSSSGRSSVVVESIETWKVE